MQERAERRPTETRIVTEREILAIPCLECRARSKRMCFDVRGNTRELAHASRIREAQARQAARILGDVLDPTDKALILYYAFIKLCDSVSTKAPQVLGIDLNSEQIQAFFCRKAVEELKKDGLLV